MGNRLTVDLRTLTPSVLVRIQVPQPLYLKRFLFYWLELDVPFEGTFGVFLLVPDLVIDAISAALHSAKARAAAPMTALRTKS